MSAVTGLRFARANLLIGARGEAVALYRLAGVNFPMLSVGEKWRVAQSLERLAHVVAADFSLWRVWRGADTSATLDVRSPVLGGEAVDRLQARQAEVYLAVSLDAGTPSGLTGRLHEGRLAAHRRISRRGRASGVGARRLERYGAAERQLHERLGAVIALRRARTRELQWLLARAPLRGVGEPTLEDWWAPDALVIQSAQAGGEVTYEPLSRELWRLPAAVLREDPAHPPSLEVLADQATGLQAVLAVGNLADEPVFPGAAAEVLHAPLESVDFPVDAVLHARWLGNRVALGQVRKRIIDAEQVYRDQLESHTGAGWQADDDRSLAREYEQVLQGGGRPPMLYARLSLALGAPDRDELERRVDVLRAHYGDVALHRPRGLQERLWLDHLPRADGGRVGDYTQQITSQQFAAMVPTATVQVGDKTGHYLGYTTGGARRPVLYDPTAPSRLSRASAVLMAGTLGSGKTVAAQLIAYAALQAGSQVIDFDPKPDHGWSNLPDLQDRIQLLELTGAPEQRGRLDPMRIGLPEMREELCVSYLLELLSDPPGSWEHAIARAVRDATHAGHHTTNHILSHLREQDTDAGGEAASALEVLADVGLARLAFTPTDMADTDRLTGDVGEGALTTIRTPGLTLPEPGVARETYTRAERISVATLSLVAALAMRLVAEDRARHKLVLLDEAWFLLASAQGRAVINRLTRLARAYNATVLLLTQRLEDLGPVSDLLGSTFIFGQDADRQAHAALELLGVQADPARIQLLRQARAGRCLMRDLDGRVAAMQVDCPDPALLAAFNTAPETAR